MKKTFYIFSVMLFAFFSLGFYSCNCSNNKSTPDNVVAELNFENTTNLDKQFMFTNYGGDYRWFETYVVLNDFLDSEQCDGSFDTLSTVFQILAEKSPTSADVQVFIFTHQGDSTDVDIQHGFWMEDEPLNNDAIKVTYKQAFEKAIQSNLPKPHSRNCVLRKPIGPQDCNPQYIFGNLETQIWVDATTGDVRNSNPAYPDNLNFKYAFTW